MDTHSNPKVKTTRSDEWIHRMNINTVSKILIIKRNGAWMRQSALPVVPGTRGLRQSHPGAHLEGTVRLHLLNKKKDRKMTKY